MGKTTYVNHLVSQNPDPFQKVYSADVIPENMVRKAVKEGRRLTLDQARSIYCQRSYEDYRREHLEIWKNFCMRHDSGCDIFIVDAGLIQAPMYELMGLYMLTPEQILLHLQQIVDIVKEHFTAELVYIRTPYPAQCICVAIRQQQERRSWVKGFFTWLEVAPYPMQKGYSGLSGIEQFVIDRSFIDNYLIENLMIEKKICSRDCV